MSFISFTLKIEYFKVKDLELLTEMGILEKRAVGKGHYFLNLELYRILAE